MRQQNYKQNEGYLSSKPDTLYVPEQNILLRTSCFTHDSFGSYMRLCTLRRAQGYAYQTEI